MDNRNAATPVVCDMTDAPDTEAERLAEYAQLFTRAFSGKEWTRDGVLLRFRAEDGIETWVRGLAAREKACCAFFTFTITIEGTEVLWRASVPDDDIARAILAEFYALPDTASTGVEAIEHRLERRGLQVTHDAEQKRHHVRHAQADYVP